MINDDLDFFILPGKYLKSVILELHFNHAVSNDLVVSVLKLKIMYAL